VISPDLDFYFLRHTHAIPWLEGISSGSLSGQRLGVRLTYLQIRAAPRNGTKF